MINTKRHNLVQINLFFKKNIYTFKHHFFQFKTPNKKCLCFFEQDWKKVLFGKNLLECESPTLRTKTTQ